MRKTNLGVTILNKLKRGLDLVLDFVQSVQTAWDRREEVPSEVSADGWMVSIVDNKHPEPFLKLKGHGMDFSFVLIPLKDQLAPSDEYLAWMWACEQRYGKSPPDEVFLAKMLGRTDRSERWSSICTLRNLAKCLALFESDSLTEEEKAVLDSGCAVLQGGECPLEGFWALLQGCRVGGIKEQYEIVKRYNPDVAEELIGAALVTVKDLQKAIKSQNESVVYFLDLPRNEILAQMYIYAYRQTKNGVYSEHLVKYCQGLVGEEAGNYVATILWQKWAASPQPGSFKAFIFKTAKVTRKEKGSYPRLDVEIEEDDTDEDLPITTKKETARKHELPLSFPITVKEAAERFCQDPGAGEYQSVVRWLYCQIAEGKIPNVGCPGEKITPGFVKIVKNQYLLDGDGFEQAKQLWLAKRARPLLVKKLVANKGITKRGAQKWLKERLEKGQGLEEIRNEISELQ